MKDPFGTERDGNGKKIGTPQGASELKGIVSHPFGRLLTSDEVLRAVVATDDHACSACGRPWAMHRIHCEGSEQLPPP